MSGDFHFVFFAFFFAFFFDATICTSITAFLNIEFSIFVTFASNPQLTQIMNNFKLSKNYFMSSLFFQRRFLLRHFLHFTAVAAFLAPHSLHIFMYNLCFWARVFLNGSIIGILFASIGWLKVRYYTGKYTFCILNECFYSLFNGEF